MAVLADWLPDVTSSVNAPRNMVLRFLREGAQQFARETLVWEQELGSVTTVATAEPDADAFYPVPSTGDGGFQVPDGARIWQLARVDIGQRCNVRDDGFAFDYVTGMIKVPSRQHDAGVTLRVWAALEPVDTATAETVIPVALERWRSGVTNYAAAKLAAMPDQTWSRPEAVAFHMGEYTLQKSEGVDFVYRNGVTHQVARRRTRPRGFSF